MTTTTAPAPATYRTKVAWTGKDFMGAVTYAKRLDGRFDSKTKTWTVTVRHTAEGWICDSGLTDDIAYLASKGLKVVEES